VREDAIRKLTQKPWNKDFEFYKTNFVRYDENKNFNELFKKYGMMQRDYVIVRKFYKNIF